MPTEQVPDQQRELPYPDEPPRTHWDGCWKAPRHHNCAAVRVYALLDALDREREANRELREALMKVETEHCDQWCAVCLGDDGGARHVEGCYVARALLHPESST